MFSLLEGINATGENNNNYLTDLKVSLQWLAGDCFSLKFMTSQLPEYKVCEFAHMSFNTCRSKMSVSTFYYSFPCTNSSKCSVNDEIFFFSKQNVLLFLCSGIIKCTG